MGKEININDAVREIISLIPKNEEIEGLYKELLGENPKAVIDRWYEDAPKDLKDKFDSMDGETKNMVREMAKVLNPQNAWTIRWFWQQYVKPILDKTVEEVVSEEPKEPNHCVSINGLADKIKSHFNDQQSLEVEKVRKLIVDKMLDYQNMVKKTEDYYCIVLDVDALPKGYSSIPSAKIQEMLDNLATTTGWGSIEISNGSSKRIVVVKMREA